jgi:hypothetical protein
MLVKLTPGLASLTKVLIHVKVEYLKKVLACQIFTVFCNIALNNSLPLPRWNDFMEHLTYLISHVVVPAATTTIATTSNTSVHPQTTRT